jgi:hypothetical protein
MVEFIVSNMETFQIIQILNIPLATLASLVVIVAGIKFLFK